MRLEARDPLIDFAAYQLSRDVQDDQLIASIISYRNEPEADIVLVAADTGLVLWGKANTQGIKTIKLPESLKLPEGPDPNLERMRQLEQEIRQLKLKTPQLSLTFEDGNQHATFTLPTPVMVTRANIDAKVSEMCARHPPMKTKPTKIEPSDTADKSRETIANLAAAAHWSIFDSPSAEDVAKYNDALEDFHQRYAQYLQAEANFQNFERRAIPLSIWLANDGTAPAEDIDIILRFPDGFELFDEVSLPRRPQPPTQPTRPKSQMKKWLERSSVFEALPYHASERFGAPAPNLPPSNVSSPSIKRTSSYDVQIHVQRIKHQLREAFDALYVVFESYETARSFQVSYEILAADLPHKATGNLHIIIERETIDQSV